MAGRAWAAAPTCLLPSARALGRLTNALDGCASEPCMSSKAVQAWALLHHWPASLLPPALPALPATASSNCAAGPCLTERLTHVIVYSVRCPLQLFFVSNRLTDSSSGEPVVDLFLLNIDTKELQQLQPEPPVLMANGGTPYGPGKVVVTSQVRGHGMAWRLWGRRARARGVCGE